MANYLAKPYQYCSSMSCGLVQLQSLDLLIHTLFLGYFIQSLLFNRIEDISYVMLNKVFFWTKRKSICKIIKSDDRSTKKTGYLILAGEHPVVNLTLDKLNQGLAIYCIFL